MTLLKPPPRRSPPKPPTAPPAPAQASLGLVLPVQAQDAPKAKPAPKAPRPPNPPPAMPVQTPAPTPAGPAPTDTSNQDAAEIVALWAELMAEQDREARVTDPRVAQVQAFMHKLRISKDELAAYLRWTFRADDQWPKFMRKPERPYLSLDNLLRRAHLDAHLDTAMSWDTATGQGAYHGARFVAYYDGRAFT